MPYPERKDSASSGNQEIRSVRPRGGLQSRAEKDDRAGGEGFLDSEAIEPGLGNGEFGGRLGDGREDQQESTGGVDRRPRGKEQRDRGAHN